MTAPFPAPTTPPGGAGPRRLGPVVLLLWVAAAVAVITAAAVAAVVVLGGDDEPEVRRAPDPPEDLCAVIGTDDLAAWVPAAEWEAATDGNELNTEATCTVDTEGGTTEDLAYGSFTARVYRYGSVGDPDRGEAQAVETIDDWCAGSSGGTAGVGDTSCVTEDIESAGTGSAKVDIRAGADLVSVTYYANPLTSAEAGDRAVEAARRIVAALDR